MRSEHLGVRLHVTAVTACCLAASRAMAQAPYSEIPAFFVGAGLLDYSLGVDGRSFMVTGTAERPVTRSVVADGGVSYARIRRPQLTEPTNYLIAELQVQA